jgi:hypothetical protein
MACRALILIGWLLFAWPAHGQTATGTWEQVGLGAFSPRDVARPFVHQGRVWISNGWYNGGLIFRDLWSSEDGQFWQPKTLNTPYEELARIVPFRGELWAVAKSVWHSRDGAQWKRAVRHVPFTRYDSGLVAFRDQLLLFDDRAVWTSANGRRWRRLAGLPFAPRSTYSVAVFRDRLWAVGGFANSKTPTGELHRPNIRTFNDVWSSPDGVTWSRVLESAPWPRRMWQSSVVHDDALYIIGGMNNTSDRFIEDVWMTRDGDRWVEVKTNGMYPPRHSATAISFGAHILLIGGATPTVTNQIWRLTIAPDAQPKPAEIAAKVIHTR